MPTQISTRDEWEAEVAQNHLPLVLQVTATWCKRCPQAHEAIKALYDDFCFRWLETDAADTELVDVFEITKLPALVIVVAGVTEVHESVSPEKIRTVVEDACDRKLAWTDDF